MSRWHVGEWMKSKYPILTLLRHPPASKTSASAHLVPSPDPQTSHHDLQLHNDLLPVCLGQEV
jgi:hypothetical protein